MRVVLHADLNSFYASVECRDNPALHGHPVAVCGDPEARHGVILAKNPLAKKYGVATGEPIYQAKNKCPGLVLVTASHHKYHECAKAARAIYNDYTDRVEPFGLDEAWLELSQPGWGLDTGERIANEIRERIRATLNITCSVGVANNKVFAKLGSDMRKPDATTLITPENMRDKVWRLSVDELLYVGRATRSKFMRYGIYTIGDLARFDKAMLCDLLGVWGDTLWTYANGLDNAPVRRAGEEGAVKSIGNSTTTPRDVECEEDAVRVFWALCEQVAARLREERCLAHVVSIWVRDCDMVSFERQRRMHSPTNLASLLMPAAMGLFKQSYPWIKPLRSLGVRTSELIPAGRPVQLSMFDNTRLERLTELEYAIDAMRRRFGHDALTRASLLKPKGAPDDYLTIASGIGVMPNVMPTERS